MEGKLRTLQLKKANLLLQMESLSSVNESAYTQLGKVEFELKQTEKQIVRESKNHLDEE